MKIRGKIILGSYFFLFIFLLVEVNHFALAQDNNTNFFQLPTDITNVHRTELFTYYGMPDSVRVERKTKILVNLAFAVEYDEEYKVPLYVVYRYGNLSNKSEAIEERNFERPPRFQVDLRTEARVSHHDYTSSGFDRGHMAPNYGIRTQYGHIAQLETFLMSNIVPQHQSVNRARWKNVEQIVIDNLAMDDNNTQPTGDDVKDLWVISGPVFEDNPVKLSSGVAIPSGFFKIIIRQKTHQPNSAQAIALYYPHSRNLDDAEELIVTVDELEEKTSLDFMPNLPDNIEKRIEKKKRAFDWTEM